MRPILLPVLLLLACGPQKGGESSTSGTDDTGPATDGATGTPTGTPTTTTPTTTPTTDTTEGPATCDMFLDDKIGPEVGISILHGGSEPVWVPSVGCGSGLPWIKIVGGDQTDFFWAGTNCFPVLCSEFMTLDSCEKGCDDCAGPSNIRIDPGARFTILWPGGGMEELEMTAECAPGTDCQGACLRGRQAPDGTYDVQLPAFRSCTGACECEVETQNGVCPVLAPTELGEPATFKVSLQYPTVTAVDLQITD